MCWFCREAMCWPVFNSQTKNLLILCESLQRIHCYPHSGLVIRSFAESSGWLSWLAIHEWIVRNKRKRSFNESNLHFWAFQESSLQFPSSLCFYHIISAWLGASGWKTHRGREKSVSCPWFISLHPTHSILCWSALETKLNHPFIYSQKMTRENFINLLYTWSDVQPW